MKNMPVYYNENGEPVWEVMCARCGKDTDGYYHTDDKGNKICESCWNDREFFDKNEQTEYCARCGEECANGYYYISDDGEDGLCEDCYDELAFLRNLVAQVKNQNTSNN